MRPVIGMATFVLFLVFLLLILGLTPVLAQHGAGHASAGGHGGMTSHGGFSAHTGGHAFGGTHSGAGFGTHSSGRAFSGRAFSHPPLASRNFNRFRGSRIRTRGFRNNCSWYGCGWGYGYPYLGGGVDPYWWWDSGSSDDQNQQYGSGAYDGQNYDGQNFDEQGAQGQRDQDLYARSAPQPRQSAPPQEEKTEVISATVLVFRDQHKQEVQNYAIVGQTLWTFAPQRTQKIPLTDLDLPATTKANDERGVDFRVPGA
jgi:hypothetical protein